MLREPAFAGNFYEKDSNKLKAQIKKMFMHKLGPKTLPGKPGKNNIVATIIPHASYEYSGPCAAHAYKAIAEAEKPDTIVIISPTHTGMGGSSVAVYPEGEWKTPLGNVKVDTEFTEQLFKNSKFAAADDVAHKEEHAIEVHLPFLQYIFKDFKIVPITMKGIRLLEEANDLVAAILNTAYDLNKKVLVIASTDFTHYGPNYRYTPFKGTVVQQKTKMMEIDKKIIGYIEKLKEVDMLKQIIKNNSTVCGYAPMTVAIIYARSMQSKSGKLLKYYTSADIAKDKTNFVGYASIIFDKNEKTSKNKKRK